MSFTETQLIHRLSSSTTTAYILSNDTETEDKGLIMKIDTKLSDSIRPMGMTTGTTLRTPVPSRLCGQTYSSSASRWVFRAASCLQAAHFVFVAFTNDVNCRSKRIHKKAVQVLPIFLYMSLLVLAIQTVAVVALLAQSYLPLGIWFLLGCITTLGGIYCFTAVISDPSSYLSSIPVSTNKFSSQ